VSFFSVVFLTAVKRFDLKTVPVSRMDNGARRSVTTATVCVCYWIDTLKEYSNAGCLRNGINLGGCKNPSVAASYSNAVIQ
jgi:hypothetical protein